MKRTNEYFNFYICDCEVIMARRKHFTSPAELKKKQDDESKDMRARHERECNDLRKKHDREKELAELRKKRQKIDVDNPPVPLPTKASRKFQ